LDFSDIILKFVQRKAKKMFSNRQSATDHHHHLLLLRQSSIKHKIHSNKE